MARMTDGRWRKRLLDWCPRPDNRSTGKPPTLWTDDGKIMVRNWIQSARLCTAGDSKN